MINSQKCFTRLYCDYFIFMLEVLNNVSEETDIKICLDKEERIVKVENIGGLTFCLENGRSLSLVELNNIENCIVVLDYFKNTMGSVNKSYFESLLADYFVLLAEITNKFKERVDKDTELSIPYLYTSAGVEVIINTIGLTPQGQWLVNGNEFPISHVEDLIFIYNSI